MLGEYAGEYRYHSWKAFGAMKFSKKRRTIYQHWKESSVKWRLLSSVEAEFVPK
jgi:hypothetical protein